MLLTLLLPMISARPITCADNPYSVWHLNEGNGTIASDSCGARNGTLLSSPSWITGYYSSALQFNGASNYVDFGNSTANFDRTQVFSVNLWFKTSTTTSQILLSKMQNTGTFTGWEIFYDGTTTNNIYFDLSSIMTTNSLRVYCTPSVVADNNWHNLIVTYNGNSTPSGVKFYFDGVLKSTGTTYNTLTGSTLTTLPFQLSGRDGGMYGLIGALDEVSIFTRVLNQSEATEFSSDVCDENWVQYNSSCGYYNATWNKKLKYYIDSNDCGTNLTLPADNGTLEDCDYCSPVWDCSPYDNSCGDSPTSPDIITCSNISLSNNATCCNVTGLDSDCNYGGDYSEFSKLCGNISVLLVLPSYPYVDLNTTFDMQLFLYQNEVSVNASEFKIEIQEQDGNWTTFNWSWDNTDQRFEKSLIFLEEGSYPFVVSADYPYDAIQNITGTLIVTKPYYITFRIWEREGIDVSRYYNDFGFVLVEFKENRHYDPILENFIYPFVFSQTEVPVFHTPYIDGEATLKLYEFGDDVKYEVRFVDGSINFNGSYSIPEVIDGYGTNFYMGEFVFNGTDDSYDIYLVKREIHQFRWLFNLLFMIALVSVVVVSVFLFFVIPQMPQLSFYFGIGFSVILIIVRSVLWIWAGW